jgi:uncharacterized protein (TIGR02145 family)
MKLKHLFFTLFVATLFLSCNTESQPAGEVITVKLSPSFIQLTADPDKPMLMKSASAADTTQAVYGIQVYENDSAYYYGVFDDVTKMQIALTTGKNYKFKVTALKTGTGKGLKSVTATEGKYYYLPNKVLLSNQFIKGNVLNNIDLASSIQLNGVTKDYKEIDAFYSSQSIALVKGTTNINFTLLRMGFGTTFNVDSLTTGKVMVFMGNDTIILTPLNKTATTVRLFNPTKANFTTIFNTANTYSDSIPVKAQWVSASGTTVNTQATFSFIRNYQKTINIQFNSSSLNLNFEGWGNTVTDIDGNVYKTVTIGTQVWMAENLKVTKYRDGSLIPNVTSNSAWSTLTTGAYCDNNNLPSNSVVYGRLYNWYAVAESRNLAPIGWHVATDGDWTILENYLGGLLVSGGKLKESGTTHWLTPNTGASNSSGFTALAGDNRLVNGSFEFPLGKYYSHWWTSTESNTPNAWHRYVASVEANSSRYVADKRLGFSVRCVKD